MKFFKPKKITLILLSTILIVLGLISINKTVNAADETVYLQLQEFREASLDTGHNKSMAYRSLNNRIMWKISSTTSSSGSGGVVDKYRTIYCIKAGAGFGFGNSSNGETKAYTKVFDLKDLSNIPTGYKKVLPTSQNYNSLIWVLEHCYVPVDKSTGKSPTQEQEAEAKRFRDNLLREANLAGSEITDNEIDIVQQLAVWYFTNSTESEYRDQYFNLHVKEQGNSGDYQDIEDKYGDDGADRLADAQDLFYYFITEAANAGAPSTGTSSNPVSLTSNTAKTKQYGSNYIIGPFKFTANTSTTYDLELKVKSSSQDISYKLLNSSKSDVTSSGIKSLVGKDFYISVPSTTSLTGLKLNLKSTVNQTSIKYRSVDDENGTKNGNTEQPVVEITRGETPYTIEVDIPSLSPFDIALRKSITKLNGQNPSTTRLPNVDEGVLASRANTTAKYNHPKDPLATDTNQLIEYTLTIYNEGSINGYAAEIVDYLPKGIEFVKGIDTTGKWNIRSEKDNATGKTKLIITNTANQVLNAYTGSGDPSSVSLTIQCKITASRTNTRQVLTNIAEITKYSDENGDTTIVDRDSQPNNFPEDKKNNQNSYEGGVKDGSYVKGQQDDDDFERVVLEPITGKYNIKLIKIDHDSRATLQGAKFKVELLGSSNNVTQTYSNLVTGTDGTITTGDIAVSDEGTYRYRITEEEAPHGYDKLFDSLIVEVVIKIKNNSYVMESATITGNNDSNATASINNSGTVEVTIPNLHIEGQYTLRIIKVDASNPSLRLKGAKFEVTMPGGQEKKTVTVEDNGVVTLPKIDITEAQTYTYKIKEIEAPSTYTTTVGEMTVDIVTEERGGSYVVKSATLTSENTEGVTVKLNGSTVEVTVPNKQFDVSLRKFITQIESQKYNREPEVNTDNLNKVVNGVKVTTAEYNHPKNPISVEIGDTIIYTIRVYNEGEIDGYVDEVVDYIPEELEFVEGDELNLSYGWTFDETDKDENGRVRKIKTDYLKDGGNLDIASEARPNGSMLKAYDMQTKKLDYMDLQVKCIVRDNIQTNKKITNIAEITDSSDSKGQEITDRDSTEDSLTNENSKPEDKNPTDNLPTDDKLPEYKDDEIEEGKEYIPGQQDDDDFEKVKVKEFDLALRKFIVKINNKDVVPSREPKVDVKDLASGKTETALKQHPKNALQVSTGDTVLYTIRVYNEGEINGYVGEITDYLPAGLKYIEGSTINAENGWSNPSGDGKTIVTRKLENTLLKAFDGKKLEYADVQVECEVIAKSANDKLKNVAEITEHMDEKGNKDITDRDSTPEDLTEDEKKDYNPETPEKGWGYEDDDDFEDLVIKEKEFDLALRKFIVKINNKDVVPSREPKVDVKDLASGKTETALKQHPKNALQVSTGDTVLYTIRVYNEGEINGYVGEITDYLPAGLKYIEGSTINAENGWSNPSGDGKTIVTRKLENTLLKAFDGKKLEYADVQVECEVIAKSANDKLKNVAEITEHMDEKGNKDITDRDSTPEDLTEDEKKDYNPETPEKGWGYEDDDDFEDLVIKEKEFDLALRKFITAVDEREVTDRIPQFKIDEDGNYVYEHTKVPVEVENGNIVTYTLRIYNEGELAGYAEQIKDDLPDGLLFLPDNETNIEYRWVMLDENGEVTEDVEDAVAIITDYLSKEQGEKDNRNNLLLPFDAETMEEPDHRDIKIAFLVTEPNTSDRILVNEAQISDDADEDGNEVEDKDSTPDEWIDDEDDQDKEYVKVKYFDLSLRKWVTQAILVVDGKETVIETGHKAEDDPESTVKVELVEGKLNRTVLKFRYKIRITNEGEIAGSATEISDYIPKGLRFIPADNPLWREENGKVVTDQLKDVILQPGESKEVEILLTWINSKDNFGLMVNTAEISDDWNESDTPDIDSTPDNQKAGEDDIDDAPVMPSIKTGSTPTYISLALGSLVIIFAGVIFIKKYIL